MPGHQTASLLLSLAAASALASLAMTTLAESRSAGFTLHGCADAEGSLVVESLDDTARPACRREQVRVSWRTDETVLRRL